MRTQNLTFEDIKYKEWLYTNGAGAYASSTICGMNSRRYHGLLVASTNPPTQRHVLVSGIEDSLIKNGEWVHLSTNQYPNTFFPKGYNHLIEFNREPLPEMIFKVDEFLIRKTIFMVYGKNATIVSYKNDGESEFTLRVKPLFVDRDFHSLFREDGYYDFYYDIENNTNKVYSHYNSKPIYFQCSKHVIFNENRFWYKNTEYFKELLRGQDFSEDRYCLGYYDLDLLPSEEVYFIFSTEREVCNQNPSKHKKSEIQRILNLNPHNTNKFYNDLVVSSNQFLVKRASTQSFSLLAGYHWFADWGRDTMISLLGLIETGKQRETKSILSTFLNYLNEGMLPNRFPDYEGENPEYNTIDATLWMFIAIKYYFEAFKDQKFIISFISKLKEIIDYHFQGTRYGIKADESCSLLRSTDSSVQLTWMDAKIGDYVVTPRTGYAVEINALWYNSLKIYANLKAEINEKVESEVERAIKNIEDKFGPLFWNENGYLNDLIDLNGEADSSIRPNQIYAVSLPYSLLTIEQEKKVVQVVKDYLLTDFGLRSLSTDHPDFVENYTGNQWFRDTAYHQGTVWAFLLCDYLLAYLKVNNNTKKAKKYVLDFLKPMEDHFYNHNCLYGISEIFDGQNPSPDKGKGCINQAWSVFNLIRVVKACQS